MLNIPPRPSGARPVGHALRRRRGPPPADPHVARPDPGHARSTPPPIRALLPGPLLPLRGDRRQPRLGVLPGRGPDGRRGHDDGRPARASSTSSPRRCSAHDKRTRFRPGYYPFTEPSVAFDVECLVCGGVGLPGLLARRGWMTILGAGMVHPVVLQYGGLDPERYQGFAFGMGVERIANLRHAVGDLRLYMENDLRFLEQFGAVRSARCPGSATTSTSTSTPEAARRAPDPARDGGQGHRALGRRLAERRRRRAADASRSTPAPTACR